MITQPKLRAKSKGQPDAETTRFKKLWNYEWSEPVKDSLRHLFSTDVSQPDALAEIKAKHGITLLWKSQHSKLKKWIREQDELDEEAQRQSDEEDKLKAEHPDWGPEQLREAVLSGAYRRSLSRGDFKLGLATVREDRGLMEANTAREKFEFDAATAALKIWPSIKQISADKSLTEPQKVDAVRLKLFGVLPATK